MRRGKDLILLNEHLDLLELVPVMIPAGMPREDISSFDGSRFVMRM